MPLVISVAEKLYSMLPDGIQLEDLISAGTFGLLDSIESFDPDSNIKFDIYCLSKIKSSILNELQNMHWIPEMVRTIATELLEVELEKN